MPWDDPNVAWNKPSFLHGVDPTLDPSVTPEERAWQNAAVPTGEQKEDLFFFRGRWRPKSQVPPEALAPPQGGWFQRLKNFWGYSPLPRIPAPPPISAGQIRAGTEDDPVVIPPFRHDQKAMRDAAINAIPPGAWALVDGRKIRRPQSAEQQPARSPDVPLTPKLTAQIAERRAADEKAQEQEAAAQVARGLSQ